MTRRATILLCLLAAMMAGCGKKVPPLGAGPGVPTLPPGDVQAQAPPPAPPRAGSTLPAPAPPLAEDAIGVRSLEDLNRDSPLKPAFFALDSSDLDDAGRAVVTANAEILRRYPTWMITIEGHCDERGTAEYNLALGERRAVNTRAYLLSLGIPAGRVRTVSYGKEFPFDPGHTEAAWSTNRRGHFVITAK